MWLLDSVKTRAINWLRQRRVVVYETHYHTVEKVDVNTSTIMLIVLVIETIVLIAYIRAKR